ncbi:MAG: hypothetical protein K9M03_01095 [Kiritimatiellales bacterium]|nr:hypothetical protein [Kiritimatiellales bacterium]
MKKFSLLVGALGGATAGYLLSNKKLRDDLSKCKDPEDAAKLLGKHLQRDGKKLAKHVQEFVDSEDVQKNINKAKKFTQKKVDEAKKEIKDLVGEGKSQAKKVAKKGASKAKKAVKKGAAKAKKAVTHTKKKVTKPKKKTAKKK